jgi:hypothetical protein
MSMNDMFTSVSIKSYANSISVDTPDSQHNQVDARNREQISTFGSIMSVAEF